MSTYDGPITEFVFSGVWGTGSQQSFGADFLPAPGSAFSATLTLLIPYDEGQRQMSGDYATGPYPNFLYFDPTTQSFTWSVGETGLPENYVTVTFSLLNDTASGGWSVGPEQIYPPPGQSNVAYAADSWTGSVAAVTPLPSMLLPILLILGVAAVRLRKVFA
jgi:hypothetical protein